MAVAARETFAWLVALPQTHVLVSSAAADRAVRLSLNREAGSFPGMDAHTLACGELDNRVLALVSLRPAFIFDPLQMLSECERMQYNFWRRLAGGSLDGHLFFFAIVGILAFRDPRAKQNIARTKSRSIFIAMEEGEPERLVAELLQDIQGEVPLACQGALRTPPSIGLRVPAAFAGCCARGVWSSVGACDFQPFHHLSQWGAGWNRTAPLPIQLLRSGFRDPLFEALGHDELQQNTHEPDSLRALISVLQESARIIRGPPPPPPQRQGFRGIGSLALRGLDLAEPGG